MSCRIYLRVSTDYQVRDGISLEMQEEKCVNIAKADDLVIKKIYIDAGQSGRSFDRPQFQLLLKEIEENDVLIFYSLSRLSRNTRDLLNLMYDFKEKNINIICANEKIDTTSAAGKAFFQISSTFSEFESNQTSERVKDAMRAYTSKGGIIGRAPYGWTYEDKKLVEVPREQEAIKIIIAMKPTNKVTEIIKFLDENDYPCGKCKSWDSSKIYRILRRENYLNSQKIE